jgi:tRNA threonylcarbamoyladenosine dehydratase
MFDFLSRTELLLGRTSLEKFKNANVIIFGLGGVGASATEMLVRAGIGNLTIIDGDNVVLSNLNRQIAYTQKDIGNSKINVIKERIFNINPLINLKTYEEYVDKKDRFEEILLQSKFTVVLDAIDTLSNKCNLILSSKKLNIPVVSSFGAGGRMDVSQIEINDISKTKNCRLAYYARRILKRNGLKNGVRAIYSKEIPSKDCITLEEQVKGKKSTIGTISYLPTIFGCYCASEIIKIILDTELILSE